MAGCGGGCGDAGNAIMEAKNRINQPSIHEQVQMAATNGKVRMEFIGEQAAAITYHVNGNEYRGANSRLHKYKDAEPGDVAGLVALGKWRVVRSQASAPAPLVTPPSSPMAFNWGVTAHANLMHELEAQEAATIREANEHLRNPPETFQGIDKAITTGFREPDPAGQIAIAPAFSDDYQVVNMTISDVKTAIGNGVDKMTLLGWLEAEQRSEKPRAGVVAAVEKALE